MSALLVCALALLAPSQAAVPRDGTFWSSIIENEYALPEGESAAELIGELSLLLGSTDPEERDTFGYSIPAHWIYRQRLLSGDELRALVERWSANLRVGIGSRDDDSVLLRSFSALDLTILAALDNVDPFLDAQSHARLLDSALGYLVDERDLRGYVTDKGWLHSAAHTADLLRFLGRSRHLRAADQARVLDGIFAKMDVSSVYAWGEDERLANAVLSVVRRDDFDRAGFDRWLDRLAGRAAGLWDGPLDTARFQAVQNGKNLLRALLVLLEVVQDDINAHEELRARILSALRER